MANNDNSSGRRGLLNDDISRRQNQLNDPKNGYAKSFVTYEDFSPLHLIARDARAAGQCSPAPGHHGQPFYPSCHQHQPYPTMCSANNIGSHPAAVQNDTHSKDAGYQCNSSNGRGTASVGQQQQTYHNTTLATQRLHSVQQQPYPLQPCQTPWQPHPGNFPYQPTSGQLVSSVYSGTQSSFVGNSKDRLCRPLAVPSQHQPFNALNGAEDMKARAAVGGVTFRPPNTETYSLPRDSSPYSPSTASLCFLVKRCVAILQGKFSDAEVELLGNCITRMGFSKPKIYREPEKAIPKEVVEREIGKLVDGLSPGSNLLLIIATRIRRQHILSRFPLSCVLVTTNGIELDKRFLMEQVYEKVARDNNTIAEWRENRRRSKSDTFDSRSYEGVTLHVVLDGLSGCVLPEALLFEPDRKNESSGLRATWVRVPKGTENHGDLSLLKNGRIVQICSGAHRYGHSSGNLLSVLACVVNAQAYVPYNVLAYNILLFTNHFFCETYENGEKRHNARQMISGASARTGGEIATFSFCAMTALYQKFNALAEKRRKEIVASMLAKGEMLFSSANRFDPNLCVDVDWDDDEIPLSHCMTSENVLLSLGQ